MDELAPETPIVLSAFRQASGRESSRGGVLRAAEATSSRLKTFPNELWRCAEHAPAINELGCVNHVGLLKAARSVRPRVTE